MARSIWKGSIAFGLVQIPVGLYSAQERDDLSFTMLDRHDFSPVGYERINKRTGKKVAWDDIVKGYEHSDGEYVVLTDEDFEEANPKATQTIDIVDFVDIRDISPIYFETPYYLAPAKAGQKAYALLRETLKRTERAGIAKVVIRTRQHLAALMPHGEVMTLVILRFADELRTPDEVDATPDKTTVSDKELAMAQRLVEEMVGAWEPTKYRDDYREDLLSLIDRKAKAGLINTVEEKRASKRASPRPNKVVDLMDLLKRSLSQRDEAAPAKAVSRKTTPKAKRASAAKPTRKSKSRTPARKSA